MRLFVRLLPLCILSLLIAVKAARALDPSQPASSYLRTKFTHDDGLPGAVVNDLVQSREGFLWINVQGTLTRFDGRRFTELEQEWTVTAIALAPDGDLWVGVRNVLKRIPAASLNQWGPLPAISYQPLSGNVKCLHFSRSGVLWVGTDTGLYRFQAGVFSLVLPELIIQRVEEASNGHLLLITSRGFVELDDSRIVSNLGLEKQLGVKIKDIFHVFEDSRGVTWFCTEQGVARRTGTVVEKLKPWGSAKHAAFRVYEDPDGSLWIATAEGLFRGTPAGLERVAAGMDVRYMYGDDSGDLWVGTNGDGLFRFKDRAARMFTTADGLPSNVAMTVLASQDGSLWTGFNCGGLSRFDGKRFRIYNEKNGLLNSCVWSLAEDLNADLWIGTWGGGVFRLHNGGFTQYSKAQRLASDIVLSLLAARDGSMWMGTGAGVSHLRDGRTSNYTSVEGLPAHNARNLYEDRTGEIWAMITLSLSRLAGDHFVKSPLLPENHLSPLGEDRDANLYFSAQPHGEIFRMENNRLVFLLGDVGAEGMVETAQGDLWLSGQRILRIPKGGFEHRKGQDEPIDFETFGRADGFTTTQTSYGQPNSTLSRDGKLWIATTEGLAMVDLLHLPRTDRKADIYMELITVGRNQQLPGRELVLPAGTHHVELNFDAIEISSPEKIRLQYRLDSVDPEWLDASSPGRAIYSNIPPGTHAFHVRACNRSGIWDRAGMVYYITQQPYFYQTRWFLAATIAFGLLVIAGLYQLRMREIARTLNARFEGRLAERTRIARELHDTLLQSLSALLLRFQTVSKMLPARPEEAKQRVDTAIEQASDAIAEGRNAVQELRSGGVADDLAQAIGNLGRELLSGPMSENPPEFHVQVEGTPKNLNLMVRDEAYRIAAEALRNAIRHAGAKQIEVEIQYGEQELRLHIRDNGKGIDPGVLDQGHAPGHWGLRGMRERAKLLGGNLEVWSEVGSGSEVELTLPAASAYAEPASRWSTIWRWRQN